MENPIRESKFVEFGRTFNRGRDRSVGKNGSVRRGMFVMRGGWLANEGTLPGGDKRVIARFAREQTPPNSQIRGSSLVF